MNLVDLVKVGCFSEEKWSCDYKRCKEKAPFVRVTSRGRTATFGGRCEKHKDERCVTLKQFTERVLEGIPCNTNEKH